MRDIEVPRSLVPAGETKAIELHLFTDASTLACSTVAIAVVDQDSRKSKGLLASKSRLAKRNTSIPRLELVGGQMGANLARNLTRAHMYERLIREIKKTLYKTLGKTHLSFVQLEAVVMDIERHLNNRPLTYVESDGGDEEVLTPNSIVWGQQSHILQDIEVEDEELKKFNRRLVKAREHAWTRLRKEYIHGLMESHRINRAKSQLPEVGEIVLIVGEERNRGKWMKGKVTRIVKGVDGVVRGVILLHKGNRLERPLQAICPLEIRSVTAETVEEKKEEPIKPV